MPERKRSAVIVVKPDDIQGRMEAIRQEAIARVLAALEPPVDNDCYWPEPFVYDLACEMESLRWLLTGSDEAPISQ